MSKPKAKIKQEVVAPSASPILTDEAVAAILEGFAARMIRVKTATTLTQADLRELYVLAEITKAHVKLMDTIKERIKGKNDVPHALVEGGHGYSIHVSKVERETAEWKAEAIKQANLVADLKSEEFDADKYASNVPKNSSTAVSVSIVKI